MAFSALPEVPMVPRPSDPRVGYFTNAILVGGPRQATTVQHVISRWDLTRHQQLKYVIDRAVPKLYLGLAWVSIHLFSATDSKFTMVMLLNKGRPQMQADTPLIMSLQTRIVGMCLCANTLLPTSPQFGREALHQQLQTSLGNFTSPLR